MLKVLIADNETTILKGLMHCVRWEQLDCEICALAEDGIAALEACEKHRPDILISDIRMPGMDGLELARVVSERYPQIKIILLTGFPDFEYAQRAIQYRVVAYILKPTSAGELMASINKAKLLIAEEHSKNRLQQELADQSEKALHLQRILFLEDLISGRAISQLYVLTRTVQLKLDLSSYYALSIVISPLEGAELTDAESGDALEQAKDILRDCFAGLPIFYVKQEEQRCCAILCTGAATPIRELAQEAVSIIGSMPHFTLSIGISTVQEDALQLPRAVEEAEKAQRFSTFSPNTLVVCYSQLPESPAHTMDEIYTLIQTIGTAVEYGGDEAARKLSELFLSMQKYGMATETVRKVCVYVYQMCASFRSGGLNDLALEDTASGLQRLIEAHSTRDMERILNEMLDDLLSQRSTPVRESDRLIENIRDYVQRHFAEDLSLEKMSELFHISPAHFSRVFKKGCGENFSTYLQKIRINHAKQLLLSTDLKSYEVAEKVGIQDPVYFARIFKKVTGLKPKDFRAQAREAE